MNCQRENCPCEATAALALNVPATGMPIPEHDPIRIVLGLQLCAAHVAAATPKEFLDINPGLVATIEHFTAVNGLVPPDFSRAFLSGVPLDSPEWKRLQVKTPERRQLQLRLAEELRGTICQCGGTKKTRATVCYTCWRKLPKKLQRGLYQQIGSGYEEAYAEAVEHLKRAA